MNTCCCADRIVTICNVGDCALNVTSVRFQRHNRHFQLLHNPFPAKLRPGSCLPLTIQSHATEKCARIVELVIESDDPVTAVKVLDVRADTIWDSCGCKEHCEDCRKGCCDKPHREANCHQGYPCGCDDDDGDHHHHE